MEATAKHGDYYSVCYCLTKKQEQLDPTIPAVKGHSSASSLWIRVGTPLGDVITRIKQKKGAAADVHWLDTEYSAWRKVTDEQLVYRLPKGEIAYLKFVATETRMNVVPSAPRYKDEVAALAASVPGFPLDQEPTREALERYLHDFGCLEGLVPVASKSALTIELPQGLRRSPFFISESELGLTIARALLAPHAGKGEIVANSRVLQFLDILHCLKTFAGRGSRLDYDLFMETATSPKSTQAARCRKRKRPNLLVEHQDMLILLGEGKDEDHKFAEAMNGISAKLDAVPDWVYGNVNFLLAFVLAGFKMQFFVKRASMQEPEQLTDCYALDQVTDRLELVLVTIKLYFLCLSICKRVVPTGMLPLFKKHARNFSTIELDGEGCVKTIERWSEYKENFGVCLADVKKAYMTTRVEQLVYANSPPTVNGGRYMVRTAPLGLPAKPRLTNEHECKSLAKDLLTALAALHEVNLVHRDVRLDNVIWWPVKKCYVLIDLETAATAGKKMLDLFTDYTSSTLVDGKYVKSSDLYQLGVLLEELAPIDSLQASFRAFDNALKSHKSTAKALLTHAWLMNPMQNTQK